jgi:hypothetical protein
VAFPRHEEALMSASIVGTPAQSTSTPTRPARALLACGAVAAPVFVVVAFAQALSRNGFDLLKHPISLLSLGGPGWIQITNFIVAGLLFFAGAVGVRRTLGTGRAGTWGPRLLGAFGVALVAGGVFVTDPALGYPPGTPEGVPDEFTWHGMLHAVAPVLGFLALSAACFVFARRAAGLHQRAWAAFSVFVGVVIQLLGAVPNVNGNFLYLTSAMVLGFGWTSVQIGRLMHEAG